nr:YqaE/Pmp3 family membrane protein [Endozoicomonas sp. G2_1]
MSSNNISILNLILAILLPPLGAFLQVGLSKHFIINLILTLCGFLPGVIHAIWLVVKNKKG